MNSWHITRFSKCSLCQRNADTIKTIQVLSKSSMSRRAFCNAVENLTEFVSSQEKNDPIQKIIQSSYKIKVSNSFLQINNFFTKYLQVIAHTITIRNNCSIPHVRF